MSTLAARPPLGQRRRVSRSPRALGWAAAVLAALVVLWQADVAGAGSAPDAIPEVLRAGLAAVALFGLAGYAPARLLLPRSMRPHLWLFVLPIGAVVSSLALTLLGFLYVPLAVSLAVVLAGGGAGAVAVRLRAGATDAAREDLERAGGRSTRLWWPLYIGLLVGALALLPVFRGGEATVIGENPDAMLASGTAELLQNEAPRTFEPSLPVDKMPPIWRSKYPILYALAGVSSLSGLEPWQAFATLSALLLAVAAAGFLLLAYHGLGAGRTAALLAMALAALDRVVLHLVVHPYYNQLWGLLTLPLILLFGFRFLREPNRRDGALFVLFAALGTFAYPLMMYFPGVALGACAFMIWRRRRAGGKRPGWIAGLRLPRSRRAVTLFVLAAIASAPFAVILVFGVLEKARGLGQIVAPWSNLAPWTGDIVGYPFVRVFGLLGPRPLALLGVIALFAAAWYAVRRLPREVRIPLYVMTGFALFFAAYFGARLNGGYLYFKDASFLGPLVLTAAVAGLAKLAAGERSSRMAAAAIAALAVMFLVSTLNVKNEIAQNFDQLPPTTIQLRDWARELPRDASVRIDVPPGGAQLWTLYFLHERRVSATTPLRDAGYPSPPRSRRADYVVVGNDQPRPFDALGPPLRRNAKLSLYRLRPGLPGPDRSSFELVQPKFSGGLD